MPTKDVRIDPELNKEINIYIYIYILTIKK